MKGEGPMGMNHATTRLDVRQLTVYRDSVRRISNLSFALAPGTTAALVGANGSGKSALILALAGFNRSTGEVYLDGKPVNLCSPRCALHAGIALCPADRGIFYRLTVEENLAMGGYTLTRNVQRRRVQELLERFPNLACRRGVLGGQLSGGEQQQLAIARALMVKPRLLLLDEPSRGLSPSAVGILLSTIHELAGEGMTVLLVDQALDWLHDRVDRLLIIADGRLIADSDTNESSMDDLAEAYFDLK